MYLAKFLFQMIKMEFEEDKRPDLPEINPTPGSRPFYPVPQTYPGIPKMPERFASIQKKSIQVGKFTFIVRKLKL